MTDRHHTLHVYLPEDRRGIGDALLCTTWAMSFGPWPVLGKADNRTAARHGNPSRDPIQPYGDTPLGAYWPRAFQPVPANRQARFGAHWLPLVGRGGDAWRAMEAGRGGLYLHGGRGDILMPTYGCLRMRDRDLEKLAARAGGLPIRVVVDSDPDMLARALA